MGLLTKMWRAALVAALVVTAGACTLPWQQLALPGPVPPVAGPAPIAAANRSPGTSLSTTSAQASVDRAYPGTAQFTDSPPPRALPPRTSGPNGVTINLAGASIAEAAKIILGDTLGLSYVVSEKLQGSITIQMASPIPREALLEVFETILSGEGAAIVVDSGGIHHVLPVAEAKSSARLLPRGARRGPGVGTQVIALQYVSAAEMERVIKSLSAQATILRTDTARNLLVVAGTRSELDAITDAVSVFDVDWMRGMSFGIFPVESGDPEAVAQELDTIFANDSESPTKGMVRFVPNRRLRAILVIASRPVYLQKAATWLRRIDMVSRETAKQVHVYHIQHRPAAELALLLQKVYGQQDPLRPGAPGRGATPAVLAAPGAVEPVAPRSPVFQPVPGVPAAPVTVPAQPGAAPPADGQQAPAPGADAAGRALPPGDDRSTGVSIIPDDANNALVITATRQEYARMRRILERIDVQPNQVLLESTIAEVRLNDNLKFGLRWFFQMGNHELRLTDSAIGAITPTFPGFSHFFSTPNVQVVLNALSTITDVNVVSSPTLMVLDNKKATLQVGDEVPIPTQSAVSVLTPGAPIVNSITFRNTGIILNITPRISDGGRVLLDIEQEVSDVVRTTTSTIDAPTIQQRRIRTTVSVNDGEAVVLGGMMQDRATNVRGQVPLVGDIPVLGNLFKNKDDLIVRTELLIAITPRIVKDTLHMRSITEEFRSKINLTTRPQRSAPPDRREQVDRLLR